MMATPVLFTAGASLAYFIAVPLALKFLFGFQGNLGGVTQEALPDIGNYLKFMMQFMFGFGFAFLMPVLLMLLETVGIVTRDQLVAARRYAIVGAFAISAVLTPPDIGSQLLLAIPLCLLYELTLIATWFTQRRRKRAEEAETEAETA
jgi:sec-independent protein translocase protein TatC